MKRKQYNEDILERCTELLQSRNPSEIFEGAVLSAYLIEQAFKSELKKVNPLLYFDKRNISDETEIRIVMGRLQKEDLGRLKTSNAKRFVVQMCEYKSEIALHKANLEELFEIRNSVLHSIDDLLIDENSVAETAVSALRACRKYIIRHSGISAGEFNPLTSAEFEKLQERKHEERLNDLKLTLKEHRTIFEKLSESEILSKIHSNLPKIDNYTWIEETVECPACNQTALDKIGAVDVDWNPDGMLMGGGYSYLCRVCELDLSEYEYELVNQL